MKKLYYLIVLTLILGLVLTGCSLLSNVGQVPITEQSDITYLTKHTEGDPFTTDLIAGGGNPASAIDVGDVLVWNDEINLYVKYVITDPDWCLTETHLHVATSLEDIPQKNGNPPPGQFDYKDKHDCVTELLYTIPLDVDWTSETDLSIAAHAVVVNIEETIETEVDLEWGRSLEDKDSICSDSIRGGAVTEGLLLDIDETQDVWDWFADPDYAYWPQYTIDPTTHKFQVRRFNAKFELPKEIKPYNVEDLILFSPYYLLDDIIPINDNIYVYLNGNEIGIKGVSYPSSNPILDWSVWPGAWYVSGSFSAEGPQNLKANSNEIDIVAEEEAGWGGMGRLELKLIWHPEETAWAAGSDFPGANWATYFNYELQPVLVGTVDVYANDPNPIYSTISLESGVQYQLEAVGTAFAGGKYTEDIEFDAKYSITHSKLGDNWTDDVTDYESYGPTLLDLFVDGSSVGWGASNPEHTYYWTLTGTGTPVELWIYDIWYPNNTGSLTVKIYRLF